MLPHHLINFATVFMYMGKLQNITNLNILAINGDDFPVLTMIPRVRENSEVVMKFTQMYCYIAISSHV